MNGWPDSKIFNNAIWDIRRHSMAPENWTNTRIENYHEFITKHLDASSGELAIVTAKTLASNWYALTSRRIIGQFENASFDIPAERITKGNFGPNAKGFRDVKIEVATISHLDGPPISLEFETGRAWMAPEYYISWWIRKFPILDVLKYDPNKETPA